MALFSLSGQGPAAVGPLIGEALLKHFGFNVFFCVAALLRLVAAAATVMLPHDTSSLGDRSPSAPAQSSTPAEGLGYRALIFDRNLMPCGWSRSPSRSASRAPQFRRALRRPEKYRAGGMVLACIAESRSRCAVRR